MAIIYTYTNVTPEPEDSMVITDVSDNNYTKTSLIGEAVAASIAPGANIYFTFASGITTINSADYTLGGTWVSDLQYDIMLTENDDGVITNTGINFEIEAGALATSSTGDPLILSTPGVNRSLLASRAYAGGSNIGHVPPGGSTGHYLDGAIGAWLPLPADQDTTYTIDVPFGTTDLALNGSDASVSAITITGGTDISVVRTSVSELTINSTAVDNDTTYDLTAAANGGTPTNMDIILTGSDASVDTVTLVPGANILLTDLGGNNLQIAASGLPGSGTVTEVDATVDQTLIPSGIRLTTNPATGIIATGDVDIAWNGLEGDILYGKDDGAGSVELTKLPIGNTGEVLTVDALGALPEWSSAGTGSVTSVGATNAMGASSGITFVTNPIPITGAGTVDLSFAGAIGDIWYADTTTSMNRRAIGSSTITPTASVINQVLSVDGLTNEPRWESKEIAIQDEGIDVETAPHKINFTGEVTASSTGPGTVDVNIPIQLKGQNGSFTPVLVTQGVDGTSILALESNLIYTQQEGSWNIIDRQVYFDFYMEFKLNNPLSPACRGTLGVAAVLDGSLIGLDEIDSSLSDLNTKNLNNAGVNICDVEISGEEDAYQGWLYMPQNGKLNKFWGMDPAPPSNKSVAWLAWNNSQGGTNLGGYFTQYTMPLGDTWIQSGDDVETKRWRVSGSLNPILNIDFS